MFSKLSLRRRTDCRIGTSYSVAMGCEPLETRRMLDSTVVINELMYHQSGSTGYQQEWVELHNQMVVDVDLAGWRLANGVEFEFPEGTRISGRGYLVVAANVEQMTGVEALGPLERRLSNGGERVELRNNSDRLMDHVDYRDSDPWSVIPDGSGATLAKTKPMTGSPHPENWRASRQLGGTPGAINFPDDESTLLMEPVRFNEMAAAGGEFWLELTNQQSDAVNLGNYVIAESTGQAGYRLPDTELSAGDQWVVDASQLGFQPEPGDRLFLYTADGKSVVDGRAVSDRLQGWSETHDGRWLFPYRATPGQPNDFSFHNEIVINEVQYHAPPELARPVTPATFETIRVSPLGSTWLYNQAGRDLGANWYETIYTADQVDWFSGPAPVGYKAGNQADFIQTFLASPRSLDPRVSTYYFQRQFDFNGDLDEPGLKLQLSHLIDDAAVFYLNGVEIQRFHLPNGPIRYETLSSKNVRNAEWVGPVFLPIERLHVGTNTLSVEVHQRTLSSNDIVMDADLSLARPLDLEIPSTPFQESDEEWIELYNRGDQVVDLSGWQLDDAVSYDFPAGTILHPGEYLVIASDASQLQQSYPQLTSLVGQFSGRLSDASERIVLLDDDRNPADEVTYFDRGYWPEDADGKGSTLELRDPRADNSRAEAWAASDESHQAAWQSVTYRGDANSFPGTNDPTKWNELVFGLLDGGEVLIDDVSVVEDPDGAAVQLIQNGSFDDGTDYYRFLGNHGIHGRTRIVPDPEDAENPVLHLVATGPTEHMSNHVETTFIEDRDIASHLIYEISFRVRRLRGSGQFNTRLYFNRLPRTTIVDVPKQIGTPGARNSTSIVNVGPTFDGLQHSPTFPSSTEGVTVSVKATDPDGVAEMTLWYSSNGAPWSSVIMQEDEQGEYRGVVPPQPDRTLVQFYVRSKDAVGTTTMFPATGPESRLLYQVDDGFVGAHHQADRSRLHHDFHLLMTAADSELQTKTTNLMSNHRLGATIVTDSGKVYYDVRVRLKGSGYGRGGPTRGFHIRFHPDDLFRGVHDIVSVDRKDNQFGQGASHREIVLKHIGTAAGGLPGMYDDLIYIIPSDGSFSGPAQLQMARYDSDFLDSSYENGSDGTRFKLELIYFVGRTEDGDVEGSKLTPGNGGGVLWVDIADMGDDKEAYRWNFLIKNHRQRDDYGPLMEMGQMFSMTGSENGGELDLLSQRILDVNQWLRTFAFQSLGGVNDTYHQGLAHNLQLFVRPEDNRFVALPWDQDLTFHHTSRLPVLGNSNFSKVQTIPNNKHYYLGHLYDIISTTYNLDYLGPWIDHYAQYMRLEQSDEIKEYIAARRDFVLSKLPDHVDFQIDATESMVVDDIKLELAGHGWIDITEIRLADTTQSIDVEWVDDVQWQLTLPVQAGVHEYTLLAFNRQGEQVGNATVAIESTVVEHPLQRDLRVSELMYNPAAPTATEIAAGYNAGDFEFLELVNIGEQTISLTDARLVPVIVDQQTQGIAFDFTNGSVGELAPGQHVLVVENPEAFEFRYGTDLPIAGQWTGQLNNAGEAIRLLVGGRLIQQFTFDDAWYPSTDGSGPSLEIVEANHVDLDRWSLAAAWLPSGVIGGTPGVARKNVDLDHNGSVDATDIDLLSAAIRAGEYDEQFDLNQDDVLSRLDRELLINDVLGVPLGDTNLDRVFDFSDLVNAMQVGEYDDGVVGNSGWADGDWNGDGEFDSEDIVAAFQAGGYVAPVAQAVDRVLAF